MPKHNRRQGLTPGQWVRLLLAQPPAELYRKPSVYLCGREMEIENFRRILDYGEGQLTLELERGRFTVYGDGLVIVSLEKRHLLLKGRFLRTEFSDL